MPLARIITHFPDAAVSLGDYLTERGYTVEVLTPEQAAQSQAAEIEIALEPCLQELALPRAAELASSIDADIVIPSGVIRERFPEVQQEPAEVTAKNVAQEPKFALGSVAKRNAHIMMGRCSEFSRRGLQTTIAITRKCAVTTAERASRVWRLAWQGMRQVAVSGQERLQRAGRNARERVNEAYAAAELRRQELERRRLENRHREEQRRSEEAAAAQAAQLREQREREAALGEAALLPETLPSTQFHEQQEAQLDRAHYEQVDDAEEEATSDFPQVAPVTSLLRAPQKRPSLIAHTRGRDWKTALIGAVAASILVMVVSSGFTQRTPPQNTSQQKLPFKAATVSANPPPLIIPAIQPKPAPVPAAKVAIKSNVIPSKSTAIAPERRSIEASSDQLNGDEEYFEEVVVRHFPTNEKPPVRTGHDGVKRISDTD